MEIMKTTLNRNQKKYAGTSVAIWVEKKKERK